MTFSKTIITLKFFLFAIALGATMMFASCSKEDTTPVKPITPVVNPADTIYYGTWLSQNTKNYYAFKITADSIWYSTNSAGGSIRTGSGMTWSIDASLTPNVLVLTYSDGELFSDLPITQTPKNGVMILGNITYQRQ
jgi:hypothetical protein